MGRLKSAAAVWVVGFLLTLAAVRLYSPVALAVVVLDGATAALTLAAGAGIGLWLLRLILPLGGRTANDPCEPRQSVVTCGFAEQLILAAALGAGVLSLAVLGLGALGVMSRQVWLTIAVASIAAGILRLRSIRGGLSRGPSDESGPHGWLWLMATPFLAVALIAACLPPGILWPAEANGYDVLEYHLAAPKEYLLRGRIDYLPHNIYSNLPFNAEMLYLLCMILRGGALEGIYSAQLLNVGMGVLAVACTWFAARPLGRGAATTAGLIAATCPMLAYVSSIAYTENGLLAMTAAACGCAIRMRLDAARAVRWALLTGVFAGLACGFKYTAAPMVALPVALLGALKPGRFGAPRRATLLACAAGLLATFSPWLIKNYAATGNPVFPLARTVFPERAGIWSDDLAARWHDGHLPGPENRSTPARMAAFLREVAAPASAGDESKPRYGILLWIAFLCSVLLGMRRLTDESVRRTSGYAFVVSAVVTAATLITWLTATHLVGRFAIPLIAPLAIVSGAGWAITQTRSARFMWSVVLAVGAVGNVGLFARTVAEAMLCRLGDAVAQTAAITTGEWPPYSYLGALNEVLAKGERVLMIGEARTLYLTAPPDRYAYHVVFNRNPFAEAAAARSPAELMEWLRQNGFDYVFVHWSEMHRLRSSRYGFWPGVDERLFGRLVEVGLTPVEELRASETSSTPYATLFVVPFLPRRFRQDEVHAS